MTVQIHNIDFSMVEPGREAVLGSQGIPAGDHTPDRIIRLLEGAMQCAGELAKPVAIMEEITRNDFQAVFEGDGDNEQDAPLASIYTQADNLALYAATIGDRLSEEITNLFASNDFARGYMLDSVASEAADMASFILENIFARQLVDKGFDPEKDVVLAYSPGYCGWHITAQKKLFEYLEPHRIGISLNSSCLMTPLKSVSGVLVSGAREIHHFDPAFSFCSSCTNAVCRKRIDSLSERRMKI
jgi:hypothetical protein